MKKYPKTLFVKREHQGTGDGFFLCGDTVMDFARAGEENVIGIYELQKSVMISAPPILLDLPKKKTKQKI